MSGLAGLPRWSVEVLRFVAMIAIALTVATVYTARGDNHDTTYYACLFAGSLSQVGTTEPANCGRGSVIQWTSFGGTIDATQLSEELQQAIKCGAFPHPDVDWSGCDVHGANLDDVRLRNANLSGANLDGAFLRNSDLNGVNFTGASLVNANLYFSDMANTNLTNANLFGANLDGAALFGYDAIFCNTTMPDGSINNDDC
jgi:uncharacterized protein YjbI with pentapeptide repeats